MIRALPLALAVLSVVCLARTASAQDKLTLSGTWSAGALTESWSIGDWGDACGPKPKPQGAGAGSVQVREQGGELSIIGAGRAWSTAECWEQMPGLARTSHSQSGGGRFWRTRCSTPANDPRHATIVTTVQATDSTISLHETGQYQFVIHDTNCTASVTRTRSFTLMHRDGDAAPAAASASASAAPSAAPPAPTPQAKKAEPTPVCTEPGTEPARLEVRPSRKLLMPGDRFAFRALVVDGAGCPVNAHPAWRIGPGPLAAKAAVDPTGAVTIAPDAGEGAVEIVATVAGKSVTVTAEVAPPEKFDALLAASGLNDAGEADEAAVVVIATGALAGERGVAEDLAKKRRTYFVAIVAALAGALAVAALLLSRRARRAASGHGNGSRGALSDPPDGLDTSETASDALLASDKGLGPASPEARPKRERGKICPICGERYSADAAFCGKDGGTLVMIN